MAAVGVRLVLVRRVLRQQQRECQLQFPDE
nr:MAG TPA: hypothetical protein [Caudoviricetes sp.]